MTAVPRPGAPPRAPRGAYLLATAVFLLGSCAGIRAAVDRGTVRDLAGMLESGGTPLGEISEVPFLLDGEVVVLPEDVRAFWTAASASGYRLAGALLREGGPVGPDTYRRFAETREAQAFFANYAGKGARVLSLETGDGARVLLLVRERLFRRTLLGFSQRPAGAAAP